jgi:hypothetical protein
MGRVNPAARFRRRQPGAKKNRTTGDQNGAVPAPRAKNAPHSKDRARAAPKSCFKLSSFDNKNISN